MVLTDAPVKSGSPIVPPGLRPALLTAGLGAVLAVAALGGRWGLAAGLTAAQGLTAVGWFRLHGMWPARQGIAGVALAGFAATAAVAAGGGAAGLAGALGVALVLVLVWQTFRPADPAERFYALTVLASGVVLTGLEASLLLAGHVPAALAAVAVTVLVAAAPVPGALGALAGVALGAAAGVLAGAPPVQAGLVAVGALVGRRVASYDFPSRFVHFTAGVVLPLAVAAPLGWIGSRLLG
ncbi:hypothetical protein [Kitasatospora sp. NPDC002040]|uniref:hypothetical protein n=1 Tax=Kitasatospora sp. NPDC002040 TaxID=3154661 RepID=UPI00332C78E0